MVPRMRTRRLLAVVRARALGAIVVVLSAGCGDDGASAPDAGVDAGPAFEPATFTVFDQIPQFGIYVFADPVGYTPPDGVQMWSFGTEWAVKLTAEQQRQIGGDVAARITYHAQCDNYDRLGGLFLVVKPKGEAAAVTDARTELVRFITPFSDYRRGALATHVYPDADLSPYASVLADDSHDVWIGIAGGSNPYDGDPCTGAGVSPELAAVGFRYSVAFVSTRPLVSGAVRTLAGVAAPMATAVPVEGHSSNPGEPVTGHVTVIVSGHGSAAGGDEYEWTQDSLSVNGEVVGSFSTMIDCAPYAPASPDGNPGIFQGNLGGNPRNWCPGALVPSHSFPVTLKAGDNVVSLVIAPAAVPEGSYYATSIHFSAP
jgi:hypothetical protein